MSIRVTKAVAEKMLGKKLPAVPRKPNAAEELLAEQLRAAGIDFEPQYKFAIHRRWKLDFSIMFPEHDRRDIAVDIDGGVHRIKDKFKRDIERHNALQMAGWLHLRFSPQDVKAGRAIELIKRVVG